MISTALLAPGAFELTPSKGKGVNRTLKGNLYLLDGSCCAAYVKLLQGKQFANELLVSLLARESGLKAPTPFLVRIHRSDYPELPWPEGVEEAYGFGSAACSGGPLARRFQADGPAVLTWFVANCSWQTVVGFDVWVGNTDRHLHNLFVDGTAVWLIDHGHCLTGPNWSEADLSPTEDVPSRLLHELHAYLGLPQRQGLLHEVDKLQPTLDVVDVPGALEDAGVDAMLSPAELEAVLRYLEKRRTDLRLLVSRQAGLPMLPLAQ